MTTQDEREFLHRIATPLGTALFLVDLLLDNMQSRKDCDPTELKHLGNALKALDEIRHLLSSRRDVLIRLGDSGDPG